jgi:hypothetical protein
MVIVRFIIQNVVEILKCTTSPAIYRSAVLMVAQSEVKHVADLYKE